MSAKGARPAPLGRRLTRLALPVGPGAGLIDLVRDLVLDATGADQVTVADRRRGRGEAAVVALAHRRQLRRARGAENIVLADLERVIERGALCDAERCAVR